MHVAVWKGCLQGVLASLGLWALGRGESHLPAPRKAWLSHFWSWLPWGGCDVTKGCRPHVLLQAYISGTHPVSFHSCLQASRPRCPSASPTRLALWGGMGRAFRQSQALPQGAAKGPASQAYPTHLSNHRTLLPKSTRVQLRHLRHKVGLVRLTLEAAQVSTLSLMESQRGNTCMQPLKRAQHSEHLPPKETMAH
jgi:hypothetical protein